MEKKENKEKIPNSLIAEIKEKVEEELKKDIKTTLKDSTKEFREELETEFKDNVNLSIDNAIRREERRMLKLKNFTLFKRDIIILVLFTLLLYFGYCLYDVRYFNFMKSECEINGTCNQTTETNNDSQKQDEVVKDKDWYVEKLGYLLGNAQININADNVSSYYLYTSDHSIKDVKNSYLLNLALKQVDEKNIKTNTVNVTVSGKDLKNAYEDLFGESSTYKASNFEYGCLNFVYNADKDKYVAENNKCNNSTKQIVEHITDMYEEGNKLYIITTSAIYNKNEQSFYTFDNLYEPAITNVSDKEKELDENKKKLNSYEYTYNKVDNEYYLDSINKLK